ncbi:hypothetical protein MYXO_01834 [Myxococcaceae bacterium]|jgi:hypothetical protein|nr:hypothetical protein MYXO_01834 [Myxococcaceae bacterium]
MEGGKELLTRRSFFRRLLANREARELLLNSLAVGEGDSAKDLDRIAAHVPDPILARKIYRHFAEETKHARLFKRHLESMGFEVRPLAPELDYETLAQGFEMGTPKARIDDPRPFDVGDLVTFFCGSKAGEERACAEMAGLIESLADDRATVALLEEIHSDEIRHVSYATEELQRIAESGHRDLVVSKLRAARRAEARAHRIVSRAFMRRLMTILGAPSFVRFFAGISIDFAFVMRFLFPGGLDRPIVADAMHTPETAKPIPTGRAAAQELS